MSGLQKALFKKKWVMMSDPRLDYLSKEDFFFHKKG